MRPTNTTETGVWVTRWQTPPQKTTATRHQHHTIPANAAGPQLPDLCAAVPCARHVACSPVYTWTLRRTNGVPLQGLHHSTQHDLHPVGRGSGLCSSGLGRGRGRPLPRPPLLKSPLPLGLAGGHTQTTTPSGWSSGVQRAWGCLSPCAGRPVSMPHAPGITTMPHALGTATK